MNAFSFKSKQNSFSPSFDAVKKASAKNHDRNFEANKTFDSVAKVNHFLGDLAISQHPTSGVVQPKLKIGKPNDKYEQEADQMADRIMQMEDKLISQAPFSDSIKSGQVQRKCDSCKEEENIQRKPMVSSIKPIIQRQAEEEDEEEMLQPKLEAGHSFKPEQKIKTNIQNLNGKGHPLPKSTRLFFESRFGHDFNNVRIHDDSSADKGASAINAKAFTLRNNIVFGSGHYSPDMTKGRKLLAHELTHVVQQGHAPKLNKKAVAEGISSSGKLIQTKKSTKKKSKKDWKKALKAHKQVWDDLRSFFPHDVGKVAGTSYDNSIDYLRTSFSTKGEEGVAVSPPIIYAGKRYAKEKDAEKRKELLKREVDNINSWLQTKAALAAQKKFWDDLHNFFPNDGRKLAGTAYKNTATLLETNFSSGKKGETSTSAPIIEVGKDYVAKADEEKRKSLIETEIEKIDNWRYDNASIDNEDLSDSDLKIKLEDMSPSGKLSYIRKLKEQKYIKNDKVIEFLNSAMQSTPIVPGAKLRESGGFEVKFDNITITVLPDVYNSSEVSTGAVTKTKPFPSGASWFKTPGWKAEDGVTVNKIDFIPTVPNIKFTIQTHYSPGTTPRTISGYGVGTRPEDTGSEEKTLRFHEGSHGTEFINSIRSGAAGIKFPVFSGKVGDPVSTFRPAHTAFKNNIKKFKEMIDQAMVDQVQKVDCVGKTIVKFHKEEGTTTEVHCH